MTRAGADAAKAVTDKPAPARLAIAYKAPGSLKHDKKNARVHTPDQILKLARLIKEFGFTNPVLVDEHGIIIAGHARTKAALSIKMDLIPVIEMRGLSDSQRAALAIADNKVALDSGWNEDMLTETLEQLVGQGIDLALTAFDPLELLGLGIGEEALDVSGGRSSNVRLVETSEVSDRFWISIRGPLAAQAEVLQRMQKALADQADVAVELGTTPGEF